MKQFDSVYIQAFKNGTLQKCIDELSERFNSCNICPHKCRVNRDNNETGICNTGKNALIASYGAHFGEEAPLVGTRGSGTIFFSNCNLLCNFCQNFDISHEGYGHVVNDEQLSDIMLNLQETGCHNLNFVTPSHVVPQIISAIEIAVKKGLTIPLVYNSSAYDDIGTIKDLKGIIDIYMPDFKFWDERIAEKTCHVSDYVEIAKSSISEMYKQVGNLRVNRNGIAEKGLLIRHLVMPNDFSGTEKVLDFIAEEISRETYVNIMPQYKPEGNAFMIEKISKKLEYSVYEEAIKYARSIGLVNLL